MPVTATIAGASLGIFIQLYSNAVSTNQPTSASFTIELTCQSLCTCFSMQLRKMPLNRHPWEHVLYACIGAYSGEDTALPESMLTFHSSRYRMPQSGMPPMPSCMLLKVEICQQGNPLYHYSESDIFCHFAANALVAWEDRTEKEIQEILREREASNSKLFGFAAQAERS